MAGKVIFTEDSKKDFKNLDVHLQKECLYELKKLGNNIYLGQLLENKNGMDLSGCRKIYFNNAKHRIVYKIVDNEIEINSIVYTGEVAEILGIGERDKQYIYKLIDERINK